MSRSKYHVGELVRFTVRTSPYAYARVTITEVRASDRVPNTHSYRFKELGQYIKSKRKLWVMECRFKKHAEVVPDFETMVLRLKLGNINNGAFL